MRANVVLSSLYNKSYRDIDGSVKPKVLDFIFKLANDPTSPGLDLKTPRGVKDPQIKTARVDLNWRAVLIVSPSGSDYVLVAVKPHDDAYTFAGKLKYGVNQTTGVFEVFDEQALGAVLETSVPTVAAPTAKPVLAGVKHADLLRFGLDAAVAAEVLKIVDEDAFLEVLESLPDLQANALADLAAGRSVEDTWSDYVDAEMAEEIDTQDWEAAWRRPGSQLSFVDGADAQALQAVLEGDFAAWRVWLHPLQRKLAYHTGWNGPARVTGGAGTGKTVTAIHRARHLAGLLGPDERLLLTTFTRNLADTVRGQLQDLAGPLERVEVLNLDAVAARILHERQDTSGRRVRIVADTDVDSLWETAGAGCSGSWDAAFLREEWVQVVLAHGITDRAEYLVVPRAGRGVRLSRPQRADVWKAIESFTTLLYAEDKMTFTQAAATAAALVERGGEPVYRFGIVDEAQDLHAAHWRLLRALVARGTDDLFIVGDAHQRIYGRPLVLSRYGIETRGRSRRLTVNYRTSRQILDWCSAVMLGTSVDDLEGGGEDLVGARSLFDGPAVQKVPVASGGEASAVVDVVRGWHDDDGFGWGEIAVVAPTGYLVDRLLTALRAHVPARRQGHNSPDDARDEVNVMTMHRAKGLEFRGVVLAGLGAREYPPAWVRQLPDEERDAAVQRARNLVYVAGSRARERLAVVWAGKVSGLVG